MSGSAEELLRSALEKIVFFECRVASLESELEAARTSAVRAREEAGAARRREAEVETALAKTRGEQAVASAHNAELTERVRLLEAERQRFLSGMIERARVVGAPSGEGEPPGSEDDLAAFISELRAEIEELREWKRAAEAAGARIGVGVPEAARRPAVVPEAAAAPATSEAAAVETAPAVDPAPAPVAPAAEPARPIPTAVPALATRFEAAGRIGVSNETARSLPTFATRAERALFEASLQDLGAADPAARRRAAEGLRALGSRDAAPLVAAALGREQDAEVKSALLSALGALAEPGAAELALRELSDPRPSVRAAALESASALLRDRAVPQLAAALGDRSPLVRRRAAVLLGFVSGAAADEALSTALADPDAGVARAAAVALSGHPSARAQGALARALSHPEPEVRRAAARAVGRWSGETVDTTAPEPERRRSARRISEKLLAIDGGELRSAVTRVPGPAAHRPRAAAAVRPASVECEVAQPAAALHSAVAVVSPNAVASLASAALAEVRAALRGRTADELAAALSCDRAAAEASLRALVAQGHLVARGPRFFMS